MSFLFREHRFGDSAPLVALLLCCFQGCSFVNDADDFRVRADPDGGTGSDAAPDAVSGCARDEDCVPFAMAAPSCDLASGQCSLGTCAVGFADCDGAPATGCEQAITTQGNCGACGVLCAADTPFCDVAVTGASCSGQCRPGSVECSMDCVDNETNPMHCGGCDQACPLPAGALVATCSGSSCDFDCNLGRDDCDGEGANGCETVLADDPAHCGRCGASCPLGDRVAQASCSVGVCGVQACEAGFSDCDGLAGNGCEQDLDDPAHCGGCAMACAPGIECKNQLCDPFVEVDSAEDHVCARRQSGAVDCWGDNSSSQYEPGSAPVEPMHRVRWVPPGASTEVDFLAKSVSVGNSHTCFVSSDPAADGRMYCQGSNAEMRGGRATGTLNGIPNPVVIETGATPDFVSITGRDLHSCAIDTAGDLWCFGFNTSGQTGSMTTSFAHQVSLPGRVMKVATTSSATCAVLDDTTVHCFGRNHVGQLGRGTASSGTFSNPLPVIASSGTGNLTGATDIAAGTDEFCAITGAGRDLFCWGWNLNRSISATVGSKPTPVLVASNVGSAFPMHLSLCWVDDTTEQATCRGRRNENQFGDGPNSELALTDMRVPGLDGLSGADGGFRGGCGLRADEVYCWGYSVYGTVPRSSIVEEVPAPVVDLDGVPIDDMDSLASDAIGTCGVRGGLAYCWGSGGSGQSGNGTNIGMSAPQGVPSLSNVVAVARADRGVCAIQDAGLENELHCWSVDAQGSIGGIGTRSRPALVSTVPNPVQLDMGYRHGCALLSSQEVMCWGLNGDLQTGTTGSSVPPTRVRMGGVPILASQVATGLDFSCAILVGVDAGDVVCWGDNTFGQLGVGAPGAASLPAPSLLTNVVKLELGYRHACAVTADDGILCWGDNADGQIGSGDRVDAPSPFRLPAIAGTTPISVAAGFRSTCAAYADETVRCWGANSHHQLGSPGAEATSPRLVPGLAATVVTNGSSRDLSNCAGNDGQWWCWGLNQYGMLGTDPEIYYPPTLIDRGGP